MIKTTAIKYFVLWAGDPTKPGAADAVEVRFGPTAADDILDREAWQDWLRRHSIDPADVIVPGWVRRNRQQYRVEYLTVARLPDGRFAPIVDGEVVCEAKFVQLEGPPLPFPPIGPLRPFTTTTPETETT